MPDRPDLPPASEANLRWDPDPLLKLLRKVPYLDGDYITIAWLSPSRREQQIARMFRRESASHQVILCQAPMQKHLQTGPPSTKFRIRIWRFKGKPPAGGVVCNVLLDGFPTVETPPGEASVPPESISESQEESESSETSPRELRALTEENERLERELHTLRWEVQTLRREMRRLGSHLANIEASLEPGTEPF